MPVHIAISDTSGAELPGRSDPRHGNRALFALLYSGMENGQLLIGDHRHPFLTRRGRHSRESVGHPRHENSPFCQPS
jgi:hypothetical protein